MWFGSKLIGGHFVIARNKYYGIDYQEGLEELENELAEFKMMFNEKNCFKMKKKEKKFRNKPVYE